MRCRVVDGVPMHHRLGGGVARLRGLAIGPTVGWLRGRFGIVR